MGTTSLVIAIMSVIIISMGYQTMANPSEMGNIIECRQKLFHKIMIQQDDMGRKCRGWVAMRGCEGRCQSHVEGHWQFPYKKYTHKVCIHSERRQTVALLRNCDPGFTPGTEKYTFTEATQCSCAVCNSSETSCEGAHKRGPPSPPAQEPNEVMNDVLVPVENAQPKWTYHNPPPQLPSLYP